MRKIKTDRSLLMYIVLGIVTCNIYTYYFLYQLSQDVNEMCKEDGKQTGGLIAFILLSFITCGIYAYYWWYTIAEREHKAAPSYGITLTDTGSTVLLWLVLGLITYGIGSYVAIYKIISNTNALATAYNAKNNM